MDYFISGLKGWAQRVWRIQNVQSLNSAIVAANKFADFDEGDDQSFSSHFKQQDKGKEWKKNQRSQDVEEKGESSFPKEKGKFEGCFTSVGPHLKRDCPLQVKVNAILSTKLEREKNNRVETSKVNSLALVEDEDDGQRMILFRNSK